MLPEVPVSPFVQTYLPLLVSAVITVFLGLVTALVRRIERTLEQRVADLEAGAGRHHDKIHDIELQATELKGATAETRTALEGLKTTVETIRSGMVLREDWKTAHDSIDRRLDQIWNAIDAFRTAAPARKR